MKKWLVSIVSILLISFVMAISLRDKYTNIDFSDKSQISDFSVRLLSEEDLFEEVNDTSEPSLVIETTEDSNMNESESEVFLSDRSAENEVIIISWIDRWKDELEQAEAVALVQGTGEVKNLAGTLQQKIKIVEVYEGNIVQKNKNVFLVNSIAVFAELDNKHYFGSHYTNFMEKGKEYLVFLKKAHSKLSNIFYGASESGISYFHIEEKENGYFDTTEDFVTYADVADVEFFCNSDQVYQQLLEVKQNMIQKYLN